MSSPVAPERSRMASTSALQPTARTRWSARGNGPRANTRAATARAPARSPPDAILVPPLLDELTAGGFAETDVLVMVAVGLHRPTTDLEKREKLGALVDRVRVVDSGGRDPS